MAREGAEGAVVYVAMVGERPGQGIRGRLNVYSRRKGLILEVSAVHVLRYARMSPGRPVLRRWHCRLVA
jgi:hypothetical protein